jgi:hypothetical protein
MGAEDVEAADGRPECKGASPRDMECKGETSKQAQNMRAHAEWLARTEAEREEHKMIRLQKRRVQAVLRSARKSKEEVRPERSEEPALN